MVISAFLNVLHNLQWVGNRLVSIAGHPSLSYQVSNLIGSILQTNWWNAGQLTNQIVYFSSFPLNQYVKESSFLFLYVYIIWCKKEYNVWLKNKEREKHDKKGFHDKIMCLLWYVLQDIYYVRSTTLPFFLKMNLMSVCRWVWQKKKEIAHVQCRRCVLFFPLNCVLLLLLLNLNG